MRYVIDPVSVNLRGTESLIKWLLSIGFALFSHFSISQPAFVSAVIQDEVATLKNLPFPDHPEDFIAAVRCSVLTSSDRLTPVRLSPMQCTSGNKTVPNIEETVLKHIKSKLSISPAYLNGEKIRVLLKFTVTFEKSNGKKHISIVQNYAIDSLPATEYLGPQRIAPPRKGFERERGSCRTCPSDIPILALSRVNSLGQVTGVDILTEGLSTPCLDGITKWAKFQRYIPALHQGKYVDSITADVFRKKLYASYYYSCH